MTKRLILCLTLALFLLPFSNKAFHIDDPLFLWTAKHILSDPFHFYDFQVNWYTRIMPMHEVMQNPPLAEKIISATQEIRYANINLVQYII